MNTAAGGVARCTQTVPGTYECIPKLEQFFAEGCNMSLMLSVLNHTEGSVSLRTLDWLVTNFAKRKHIVVRGSTNIFVSYKNQLKAHTKKNFDPFCRRERLVFSCIGMQIRTTVGQLNFFRWAIHTGVLEYAQKHKSALEGDMLKSVKGRVKQMRPGLKHIPLYKPIRCPVSKGAQEKTVSGGQIHGHIQRVVVRF